MGRVTVWMLAIGLVLFGGALGIAQEPGRVDFEEHPANEPGTSGVGIDPGFYAGLGVDISSGTVLRYEEGFTSSGLNGLEMCYSQEFCTEPFLFHFDTGQAAVITYAGYRGSLDEEVPVLMVGYDEFGERVAIFETLLGPGEPVFVETELAVFDDSGRITAVEIRWSDAGRIMNGLVIDDLIFEPFIASIDVVAEPDPLILEVEQAPTGRVVFTNVGNVTADFSEELDDPSGRFELARFCDGELAPGDSCFFEVGFLGGEPGEEYGATLLLWGPFEEPLVSVSIAGIVPEVEPPPEPPPPEPPPEPPEPTAATTTVPTTAPPTPGPPDDSDPGGSGPLIPILVLVVVGGGGFAIGRWWMKRPKPPEPTQPTESRPSSAARPTLRPGRPAHEIVPDDHQPVAGVRVSVDPGQTTTTLVEEKTS